LKLKLKLKLHLHVVIARAFRHLKFLTWFVLLLLVFVLYAVVQAQDPSLSLPYWDTSIEMEAVRTKKLKHVKDAPLWSKTFFGKSGFFGGGGGGEKHTSSSSSLSVISEFSTDRAWRQAAILNGRWNFTKVPRLNDGSVWGRTAALKVEQGHHVPHNAYGYLRSPWNQNPSPYVTRFMDPSKAPKWASCRSLADTLAMSLAGKSTREFSQFW
jgi:hypothetical protein